MSARRRWPFVAVFLTVGLIQLANGEPLYAGASSTFTVTSTADTADEDTGDGACDIGDGTCTFRAAIQQANATPDLDTITFSIGTGLQTITPAPVLPPITAPVIIDGTTQPGDPSTPRIQMDGSTMQYPGIQLETDGSIIRGLVISRFIVGIAVVGSDNVIEGNFIGTDPTGTTAARNPYGLTIRGSRNRIGGTSATSRNLISGNSIGVTIDFPSKVTDNVVQGNFIGTDISGTIALGNLDVGVLTDGGSVGNLIGGTEVGAGNLISGNNGSGIGLFDDGLNTVQGNLIGTDKTGVTPLPNIGDGIEIFQSPGNLIGGSTPSTANIVAFNAHDGIAIDGSLAVGNIIRGNSIHANGGSGIATGNGNENVDPPIITALGPLSGTSASDCLIDVYSDDEDQGRVYYGSTMADGAGVWSYPGVVGGPNMTATCTDPAGNTSAFSEPFESPCTKDDLDCDGAPDDSDNCPNYANPAQIDEDSNGSGDSCQAPSPDVDCSGEVNAIDALKLLRHSADLHVQLTLPCLSLAEISPPGRAAGDVNCDGGVDAVDALTVLRLNAALSVIIPAECPPVL